MWLVVSGGTQINGVITHGSKEFEEQKNNVAGRENQEIGGGVLADSVEKARHTTNAVKSSIASRGIYDDKQDQGVFYTEGIGCRGADGRKQKEHTICQ